MLRSDLGGIFLCIISHKRADNVKKMQEKVGPATWIVGDGEADAYVTAGAAAAVEGGRLCPSRNKALDLAFALGVPCLQLSDDLGIMYHANHGPKGPFRLKLKLTIQEYVAIIQKRLKKFPQIHLAGVNPTSNELNVKNEYKTLGFIIGDFTYCLPCDLRYDEALTLKEDYDFTLQHLKKFGGVLRNDDMIPSFKHYDNAGGAVDYRNGTREQQNIAYLRKKWGSLIKLHPKRANEITLNL
jgi:hypothetical protein